MKSPRLAYLIMAHEQPQQLQRLVKALDCPNAVFFIHIDGKADLELFRAQLPSKANVRFLEQRIRTNWMGFSLVEATLKLLTAATREGFDYCVYLSGSDYPIKSNADLLSFFGAAREEYITFWRLEDRPSWMHKIEYYYPIDTIAIRPWSTNTDALYWRRLFWGRYFKYRKYMPKRKFLHKLIPYGGPDWWTLSFSCAQYILQFVRDNPKFARFYKYTASPGEMFFQTIVLNSPFAERVHNHSSYVEWSRRRLDANEPGATPMLPEDSFNYRYVDWSGEHTGAREKPAVLDERDWNALKSSPCHFARKFHPERSAQLLEWIDRDRLGLNAPCTC
jgi:hypothetical protein